MSVVIPVYNEESLIYDCCVKLNSILNELDVKFEIILVDDGSTDNSWSEILKLSNELFRVKILKQNNMGIGGAFKSGINLCSGEYIILWPVDMILKKDVFLNYLNFFGKADIIVGYRDKRIGYNFLMKFNSKLYNIIVKFIFGLELKDVNWISVYKSSYMKSTKFMQSGIPMLTEILVKAKIKGLRFQEVKCQMQPRETGKASASKFSVMIKTLLNLLFLWLQIKFYKIERS